MSEPGDPQRDPNERKPVSFARIVIWVVVAGIGVWYIAQGFIGMIGD
ncbi:hypothetical protein QT381_01285 [Galbitalea sp. SE-J8]|nr:hypothetical protein [Galbitalea sp. SE-J8]MDM4761641.1 hypothetical protein [Galbitalea sp. SE-J8]